jgi:hypothetical protein
VELEEGEGGHRHYCSVLEGDMSSADESWEVLNEEEELNALVSNEGGNHAKLHSQDGKSVEAILSG